ncbi:hypothetical protein SAMN05444159_3940 [Bradyrhizobium lablabi]|uniref:Uncharacterized protein n=2 Tax=Bradyrhizobium lablabi TaxID=722472 RepID=A0A1M6UK63_9BRAD|nr:hypothetical protein SAMN05444159_3940 [Bradyrhizobium lablabi]
MPPQPQQGKQIVRYFYFKDEVFRRQGIARVEFTGDLGIAACLARAEVFSPGATALSRLPARHGPCPNMGLDRSAKPANRPSLKAPNPDQSLNPSRSAWDDGMADFSIRMKNRLQFSSCEAPHIPTSKPHRETLIVELRGDLLTITERRADGGLGSRIYAQRAIDLLEASIFTILPELPSHVRDGSFFPALGTVAILATPPDELRRLRAVGTDKNSGQCHGWIFDAIEQAGPGSNRS